MKAFLTIITLFISVSDIFILIDNTVKDPGCSYPLFYRQTLLFHLFRKDAHAEKAKQYILTHLSQSITVEDIASHTGVSRYHLSHLFKASTGKTIPEYLQEERIEMSKDLLLNSTRNISEIAFLLRFCDQSHFVSVFKKKTGMTPGNYRKQNAFRQSLDILPDFTLNQE